MIDVYLSIGSNIHRNKHILAGIKALKSRYPALKCSPVYESTSIGFEGENFYNLVTHFSTIDSQEIVSQFLSNIEDENGRNRNEPKFGPRTLDIDLLLYGSLTINSSTLTLPRPEIYTNAFVLQPLADIAENITDPIKNKTYGELWSSFNSPEQKLWVVDFPITD